MQVNLDAISVFLNIGLILLAIAGFYFNAQQNRLIHTYDFILKRFESEMLRNSIRYVIDLSEPDYKIELETLTPENRAKVFDVLNYFNAVGIAYKKSHMRRDVISDQMRHTITRIWPTTKHIIYNYRKQHKVPFSFRGLEWLALHYGGTP